jgi:hypothetical protein
VIILLAGTNHPRAQVLQKPEERANLLQSMDEVLAAKEGGESSFADLTSPFVYGDLSQGAKGTIPGEETATDPDPDPEPATTQQPARLSDAEVLRMVARRFRPLGSLVIGDKGVLQMDSGRNLAEGESFQATVNGVSYLVSIADVSENGYILRLREEFLERDFLATGVKRTSQKTEAPSPRNEVPQPAQ